MKKIVFICTGNTCRSPMAEGLCKEYISKQGIEYIEVHSAGLAAKEGCAVSENSVLAMNEIGIDISNHRSKIADDSLLKDADLIVCMSEWQRDALQKLYFERVMVIDGEISDPYGGNIDCYRNCRDALNDAVPKIVERLL